MFIRTFSLALIISLVLQTMELLGETGRILAYPGNGQEALWHYVTLRFPQILSFFLPFSVLLGALWTLMTMNTNSEVISMKAAGLSAHQILAPTLLAGLAMSVVAFAFNEIVVTRATDGLTRWEAAGYGPIAPDSDTQSDIWVIDQQNLFHAGEVSGTGLSTRLRDVSYFVIHNGLLSSIIRADTGQQSGGGWQLGNARAFDVASGANQNLGATLVGRGVTADKFTLSSVNPDRMSIIKLTSAIGDLRATGRESDLNRAQTGWWHKFSEPMSALLMPLLAGIAGFGLARSGMMFVRVLIGAALGVAYFIVDNIAVSMGNAGFYPPFLAACGPFLLFALIGESVLITTEE